MLQHRPCRVCYDGLAQEHAGSAKGRAGTGWPLSRWWRREPRVSNRRDREYEAKPNYGRRRDHDPVICTYDLARFGGGMVVDIMRTHPLLLIGGILHENPFFVPPEECLPELRARRVADETPPSRVSPCGRAHGLEKQEDCA